MLVMMRKIRTYLRMLYQTNLVLNIGFFFRYSGRYAFLPPLYFLFIPKVMKTAIRQSTAMPAQIYKAIGLFNSIQLPVSLFSPKTP